MCRLTESTAKYKKEEKHNSPRLCVNVSFILTFFKRILAVSLLRIISNDQILIP